MHKHPFLFTDIWILVSKIQVNLLPALAALIGLILLLLFILPLFSEDSHRWNRSKIAENSKIQTNCLLFSSSGYGAPSTGYDSPSSGYGAPASSYDAPSDSYGTRQYRSVKVSARLHQSICMSFFFCWNQPTPRTMWVIIDLWCPAWNSLMEQCGQGRSCPR